MQVVSVNVGKATRLDSDRRAIDTGIDKCPATGHVFVGTTGLHGDAVCDRVHHGGADQAVYGYRTEDYAWWSERLGRKVAIGTFGENLTITGLPPDLHVGARLQIGDVILEATAPRIPCATLAARMRDERFGLTFRRAERPGFYFRVLREGDVAAGDPIRLIETASGNVSILELFRLNYEPRPAADALRRALAAPIAERARAKILKRTAIPD